VKDAVADYSDEAMHAALDINIPKNYAHAVVTTNEERPSRRCRSISGRHLRVCNAGAAADDDDSLPVEFRLAADGNGGCCSVHDFSRNPRSSASTFCRERCRSQQSRLLWQLCAGLLCHHVSGVPVWPIRIALAGALLMLAVGGFRAPKRARQIVR